MHRQEHKNGASLWRVSDKLADGTRQFARLVFGNEGIAIG